MDGLIPTTTTNYCNQIDDLPAFSPHHQKQWRCAASFGLDEGSGTLISALDMCAHNTYRTAITYQHSICTIRYPTLELIPPLSGAGLACLWTFFIPTYFLCVCYNGRMVFMYECFTLFRQTYLLQYVRMYGLGVSFSFCYDLGVDRSVC